MTTVVKIVKAVPYLIAPTTKLVGLLPLRARLFSQLHDLRLAVKRFLWFVARVCRLLYFFNTVGSFTVLFEIVVHCCFWSICYCGAEFSVFDGTRSFLQPLMDQNGWPIMCFSGHTDFSLATKNFELFFPAGSVLSKKLVFICSVCLKQIRLSCDRFFIPWFRLRFYRLFVFVAFEVVDFAFQGLSVLSLFYTAVRLNQASTQHVGSFWQLFHIFPSAISISHQNFCRKREEQIAFQRRLLEKCVIYSYYVLSAAACPP